MLRPLCREMNLATRLVSRARGSHSALQVLVEQRVLAGREVMNRLKQARRLSSAWTWQPPVASNERVWETNQRNVDLAQLNTEAELAVAFHQPPGRFKR